MSGGESAADAGRALSADELQVIEGTAREPGRAPCPACGRAISAGQEVATSLGDVRRGAIGVTVHRRCFAAIGRAGLLELMIATHRRPADANSSDS